MKIRDVIKTLAITTIIFGCSGTQNNTRLEMDGVVETFHVFTTPNFFEPFSLFDFNFSNENPNLLVLTKNHAFIYHDQNKTNKINLTKPLGNVYSISLGKNYGLAINSDSSIFVYDNDWFEFNVFKISQGKIVVNPKSKILLDQANHRVYFDGISYDVKDRKTLFDYNHIFFLDYTSGQIKSVNGIRHSEILINGLKEEPSTYFHLSDDNQIIVSESHDKFIYSIKQNKVQKHFVSSGYDSTLTYREKKPTDEIINLKNGLFRFNYLNATIHKNKILRLFRFQRPERNKFGNYTTSSLSKIGLMQCSSKNIKSKLLTKLPENILLEPNHISFSSNRLVTVKEIIYDKIHNHWVFIFCSYRFNGL